MHNKGDHQTLRRLLAARGLIDPAATWQVCSGGRTNRTWRIGAGQNAVICKLFAADGATPLFPNSADAEAAALSALTGTGLAPELRASVTTALGHCVLYSYVHGTPWQGQASAAGAVLRRLHDQTPPIGLRKTPTGQRAILAHGEQMAATLSHDIRQVLDQSRPAQIKAAQGAACFLHGDPVAANMIQSDRGLVLIDWQCPAIGEVCDDLAVFLSPAMQGIYAPAILSEAQVQDFLDGYGDDDTTRRYRLLAPYYHWRMAAYCAWKVAAGDSDYVAGIARELAALEQAQARNRQAADQQSSQ